MAAGNDMSPDYSDRHARLDGPADSRLRCARLPRQLRQRDAEVLDP